MNLIWKKKYENHHQSENIVLIYDAESPEGTVRIIVYMTPQMNDFDRNKRVVFSRAYFKTRLNEISEYLVHAVSDDIFELCDNFYGSDVIYKTMFTEYSIVSKFPSYKVFGFGDYSRN